MKTNLPATVFLFIIALIAWVGLIAQLILLLEHRTLSLTGSLIRFFSYFTILTNLLVAVCSTVLFISRPARLYNFFSSSSVLTATTVYIVVVGIIFNLLLRPILHMQKSEAIVSNILHVITPVLFVVFWLLFVQKNTLHWKLALTWLIYPVVYMIYTFIHGMITGFYPYPFIDIGKLGYEKGLINGTMILLVFVLLSLIFIGVGKIKSKPAAIN